MSRMWVLALGSFALGTDVFVIGGILPVISADMGVSLTSAGWLISAFAFTYAIASPILSIATGNMERRNLLLGSFGLFCAANIVSATAQDYDILLLSRLLAAAGASLYMPTASAIAVSLAPKEQRGRALALVTAGMTVAIVLGVPLGTWIGGYAGWRATFWLIVLLSAVALLGIRVWIPSVATMAPIGWAMRMALLKQPRVFATLLVTVLWTAGGFTIYAYIAPLLTQITHLSGDEIGWTLLLFGAASVAGNYVGGRGADQWGTTPTIALALLILIGVFTTLDWSASHRNSLLVAVALWGIAGWMLTPPQQHRLVDLAPQLPAAVLGLNGSAIYLGIGLGASLGGMVLQQGSIHWLGWMGGACEALALLMLLSLMLPRSNTVTGK